MDEHKMAVSIIELWPWSPSIHNYMQIVHKTARHEKSKAISTTVRMAVDAGSHDVLLSSRVLTVVIHWLITLSSTFSGIAPLFNTSWWKSFMSNFEPNKKKSLFKAAKFNSGVPFRIATLRLGYMHESFSRSTCIPIFLDLLVFVAPLWLS